MKHLTPLPFKQLFILLSLGLLISACLNLSSCGSKKSDPEPTEAERVTALLTGGGGKWSPSTSAGWVFVGGVDVSDLFTGFTITFTPTGYTTTGTTPVWPRTDTWKFKTGSTTTVVRDSDGLEVTLVDITDKSLKVSLYWAQETTSGGRTTSIVGKHEFTFAK